MFCKHDWKLLSETVTKSKLEVATSQFSGGAGKLRLPWQLCDADRKHIQAFTCSKCGKFKRFVEDI
jgi:hypothetical protein